MKHRAKFAFMVFGVAGAALLAAALLEAKAPWVKKSKDAGFADAKDCTYCHPTAKATKELNERGKWLMDQKASRKAAEVDMAWLKDYKPEPKK